MAKTLEKPIEQTVSAANRLGRPRRRSFENQGRLKFPAIRGFHLSVKAENDPNLHNVLLEAEETGYVPVKASEIGYDKLTVNPLKPDDYVRVKLGGGVSGLLMKLPLEIYYEDITEGIKYNNEMMIARKDAEDYKAGGDLIMTQGELTRR